MLGVHQALPFLGCLRAEGVCWRQNEPLHEAVVQPHRAGVLPRQLAALELGLVPVEMTKSGMPHVLHVALKSRSNSYTALVTALNPFSEDSLCCYKPSEPCIQHPGPDFNHLKCCVEHEAVPAHVRGLALLLPGYAPAR